MTKRISEKKKSLSVKQSKADVIRIVQKVFKDALPSGGSLDILYDALPKTISGEIKYYDAADIQGKSTRSLIWRLNKAQSKTFIESETNNELSELNELDIRYRIDVGAISVDIKEKDENNNERSVTKFVYPSVKEDQVEMELRRIAVENGMVEVDGQLGVLFTIADIRQGLAAKKLQKSGKVTRGSEMPNHRIIMALQLLKRSTFLITPETQIADGGIVKLPTYDANRLIMLIQPDEDNEAIQAHAKGRKKNYWFAAFHPLLTSSLSNNKRLRLTNFETNSQLKCAASRFIHSQMRLFYRDASLTGRPFTLWLSALFEGMGKDRLSRKDADNRLINTGINNLIKAGIILNKDEMKARGLSQREPLKDDKDKRIVLDWKYNFYPSEQFIIEMKAGNALIKELKRIELEIEKQPSLLEENSELLNTLELDPTFKPVEELRFLLSVGISYTKAVEIAKELPPGKLNDVITFYKLNIESDPSIQNKAGYLIKVIDEGKFTAVRSIQGINADLFDEVDKIETDREKALNTENDPWSILSKNDFSKRWIDKIDENWANMTLGERGSLQKYGMSSPHPDLLDRLNIKR